MREQTTISSSSSSFLEPLNGVLLDLHTGLELEVIQVLCLCARSRLRHRHRRDVPIHPMRIYSRTTSVLLLRTVKPVLWAVNKWQQYYSREYGGLVRVLHRNCGTGSEY